MVFQPGKVLCLSENASRMILKGELRTTALVSNYSVNLIFLSASYQTLFMEQC